jgi:hypothetical protein
MKKPGWIPFQKALFEDIRVLRITRQVRTTCPLLADAPTSACLTLVIGALVKLWSHADTFARQDDTLEATLDEIDELTGVKGFAQALPADWLKVLDENRVELPRFQEHNGSEAKRLALHAKSQGNYARRKRDAKASASLMQQHQPTVSRPDQTRPDQTREPPPTPPQEGNGRESPQDLALPANLPLASWNEWLEFRRKRRWPVDDVTLRKHLAVLAPFDADTQRAIIDSSIGSGWQGLFAPKSGRIHAPAYHDGPSTAELIARGETE